MKHLALVLSLFFFSTYLHAQPVCDQNTSGIMARAYNYSNPLREGQYMPDYMQQYSHYFTQDSLGIWCLKTLGNKLIQSGVETYDRNAYRFNREEIAQAINSTSGDLYRLGQELVWLSDVLPYAANGNWTPYVNTGTNMRRQTRQAVALVGPILADPSMRQILDQSLNQFMPIAENQVAWLLVNYGGQ